MIAEQQLKHHRVYLRKFFGKKRQKICFWFCQGQTEGLARGKRQVKSGQVRVTIVNLHAIRTRSSRAHVIGDFADSQFNCELLTINAMSHNDPLDVLDDATKS